MFIHRHHTCDEWSSTCKPSDKSVQLKETNERLEGRTEKVRVNSDENGLAVGEEEAREARRWPAIPAVIHAVFGLPAIRANRW
jgi:hypothetical protein